MYQIVDSGFRIVVGIQLYAVFAFKQKRLNVVINYKDFATLKQNKHEINTCLSYLCALYDFFVVLFSWMLRTLLSATSAAMLV